MTFFNLTPRHTAFAALAIASVVLTACKGGDKNAAQQSTFFFENVKSIQAQPEEFNSWGFPKKKLFNMSACPKDIAMLAPIIGQSFEIRDEKGEAIPRTTDSRGCMQWDEHHQYDHFAPETFINIKRTFVGTGSHTGSVEVSLAINPWTDQVLDLRYDVPQKLENASGPVAFSSQLVEGRPSAAEIDLKSMSLQFLPMDYSKWEVDSHLKLTVAHNYRLRFEPKVLRKALKTVSATDTPEKGKIKVTIVIVREGKDETVAPDQYVTHYSDTVEMVKGGVFQDITLKFPDTIANVASRMRAFVKLVPIVDSPSVGTVKLTSPIGPLPSQSSMQLVATDIDADTVVAAVHGYKSNMKTAKMKPMELFEELSGLRKIDPVAWDSEPVDPRYRMSFQQAKSTFRGALDRKQNQAYHKRLCYEVYGQMKVDAKEEAELKAAHADPRRPYFGPAETTQRRLKRVLQSCLSNPEAMLLVEMRDFVDTLQSPVVRRTGLVHQESLSISTQISVSDTTTKGSSWRRSGGYSVGANAGADLGWNLIDWKKNPEDPSKSTTILGGAGGGKFGLSAKINLGFSKDWYKSRAVDVRESTAMTASLTRAVIVEAYALEIDVVTRRCQIIAPAQNVEGVEEGGVFFCDDRLEKKTTREPYYFVNQTGNGSSPIVDGLSGTEMPWRMFIRGTHMYNSFKKIVSDANLALVLEPVDLQDATDKETDFAKKAREIWVNSPMTQDFPGMLSPAMTAN